MRLHDAGTCADKTLTALDSRGWPIEAPVVGQISFSLGASVFKCGQLVAGAFGFCKKQRRSQIKDCVTIKVVAPATEDVDWRVPVACVCVSQETRPPDGRAAGHVDGKNIGQGKGGRGTGIHYFGLWMGLFSKSD